jgi:hypothetical protein
LTERAHDRPRFFWLSKDNYPRQVPAVIAAAAAATLARTLARKAAAGAAAAPLSIPERRDLMNTNPSVDLRKKSQATIWNNKKTVDRAVRTLMRELEREDTIVPESPRARVERVLTIYRGLTPLFGVITVLPLIPYTWRAALVIFDQSLDSLAGAARDFASDFMTGGRRAS